MTRKIRFNAFDMNCVGHQSPGLWTHPRDRSCQYKDVEYWMELAATLERGIFDGIFIADVIGYYDVYKWNYHAIQQAAQIPVNDPLQLAVPISLVTKHLGIGSASATMCERKSSSPIRQGCLNWRIYNTIAAVHASWSAALERLTPPARLMIECAAWPFLVHCDTLFEQIRISSLQSGG